MSDWTLKSPYDENYQVLLGNCTREHAESVKETLLNNTSHPDELILVEHDVEPESPKKRRFRWRTS